MRKLYLTFCSILFVGVLTYSCTDNHVSNELLEDDKISMLYDEYAKMAQFRFDILFNQIQEKLDCSAGDNLPNYGGYGSPLEYLINLSESELDSLQEIYPPCKSAEELESEFNANISKYVEETSSEDVDTYLKIMEEYAKIGGHSVSYIESSIQDLNPIIQDLTIRTAAEFDKFTGTTLVTNSDSPEDSAFCKGILAMECGWSMVNFVVDGLASDSDPFYIICAAGDLVGVLDAIKSYHRCLRDGVM